MIDEKAASGRQCGRYLGAGAHLGREDRKLDEKRFVPVSEAKAGGEVVEVGDVARRRSARIGSWPSMVRTRRSSDSFTSKKEFESSIDSWA